ncbi:MAG: hypothetical protein CM15mP46_7390 [Alphaproteobacteria bacterium]|nr:MAG: hypothetical protein CM15mP46_7390 [Alphaproteobacteria bacterium]
MNLLALLVSIFMIYHIGLRLYEPAIALAASAHLPAGFWCLLIAFGKNRYGLNAAGDDTTMGLDANLS